MWAQGLMDDWTNNLKLANEKLDTLVLALDTTILELEKLDEIEVVVINCERRWKGCRRGWTTISVK